MILKKIGIEAILKSHTNLKLELIKKAKEFGFDDIKISKPDLPNHVSNNYLEFIQKGKYFWNEIEQIKIKIKID